MTAILIEHTGRLHAELGASSMARWSNCPASVERNRGRIDRPSSAAERGTATHELAEKLLRSKLDLAPDGTLRGFRDGYQAVDFLGQAFNGIPVDDDLAQCAQEYVDECLVRMEPGDRVWIERPFSLEALGPPAEMFGTADLVIYKKHLRLLLVIDLKSGAGIVVHAAGNSQLRYYGLGAMLSLPGLAVHDVSLVIIQPRVIPPVKSETLSAIDLMDWSEDLLAAARAALDPAAQACAGPWCRFCGDKRTCQTYENAALAAARDEFDVVEIGEVSLPLPDPAEMEAEELARRLMLLPLLEDWIKTMRAYAFQRLNRGDAIPGWKLVDKRPTRKWTDEKAAVDWMLSKGLTVYDAVRQHAITPAQAEALVKKSKRDLAGFDGLVVTASSGPTLVPDTDPRPALTGLAAQDEFDVIDTDN